MGTIQTLDRKIFMAIPAMNELAYLPDTIAALKKQTFKNTSVFICVNQPETWWNDSVKIKICEANQQTIAYLDSEPDFNCHIIDCSSKGRGWTGKKHGVGWARKTLMDAILNNATDTDIIVSLDADTLFNENYLQSIYALFENKPEVVALSNPYYHRLTGEQSLDRAMLRYEIYMRNYAINLFRIHSPYAFTALGSAIALPVWVYKKVGGLTPKLSGEDFYFLQKLRKFGFIETYNEEKVFPATRFSNRVFFGTGPALIKGCEGDWNSYPIYHHSFFENIKHFYQHVKLIYSEEMDMPFINYLKDNFVDENIWQPLRDNAKSESQFIKAVHEKVDGLRILQYLKASQEKLNKSDDDCLLDNLAIFSEKKTFQFEKVIHDFSFLESSIERLDIIRNYLVFIEEEYQKGK